MNPRLEVSKLAQLRAKTDRQLVQVIGSSLDAGFSGSVSEAEKARSQADRLLPYVSGKERRVLETKLARLEEELRARAGLRVRAAS